MTENSQNFPSTIVGALIFNKDDKALLMSSPKWGGRLVVPGGHIEYGEKIEEAVKREVKEETGLNIDQIEFVDIDEAIEDEEFYQKRHFIFLSFIAQTSEDKVTLDNEEGTSYSWYALPEALKLNIGKYTRNLIEKYLKYKSLPSLEKKLEEYLDGWKRAKADYLNLKKEIEKEKEDWIKFASLGTIIELLPIYENFKKALATLEQTTELKQWQEGVIHIKKQLEKVLKDAGIEEIKTVSEKFDPMLHEAIDQEKQEKIEPVTKGEIVTQELEGGYKMHGKVIKPAKVVIK